MFETYEECVAYLNANRDGKYDDFNSKIVNSTYPTLGVRTPVIKKLAKQADISRRDDILTDFFADTEKTYDVVLFAGCVAARKGDYAATREYLKKLIPLFGSWAHVDCVVPMLDWTDVDTFLADFDYLGTAAGEYEVRTYIIYLMNYCLTADRIDFALDRLQTIEFGKYYVDMAAAWMLAEALVKQYDKTLPLIESKTFPKFVHNKAIQKARESYRIDDSKKALLGTFKRTQ